MPHRLAQTPRNCLEFHLAELALELLFKRVVAEATHRPAQPWQAALGGAVMLAAVLAVLAGFVAFQPPERLSLQVLSEPAGADVFVDGQKVGSTPVRVELSQRHRWGHVRLTHPSSRSWEWRGHFPASGRLALQPRLVRIGRAGQSH